MPGISLTPNLRQAYSQLFSTLRIRPERQADVERLIAKLAGNQARYRAVADPLNIPWHVVAVLHNMETGQDFAKHLHNGDPLTARTARVPKGFPKQGKPPFAWEVSAKDALTLKSLHKWTDWSLPGTLYKIEEYNGWGYRLHHPHVLSPYLWSGSQHYTRGKYVADGTWSETAISRQIGAAVLLRRMAEKGLIAFPPSPPLAETLPLARYTAGDAPIPFGRELQEFLNGFPGVFLKVDGVPGQKTSDAFKQVTGYFLKGDPRAGS